MPVLQLDDQLFPLSAGSTRIGTGAGSDVVVPGYSSVSVEAVIDGGAATIRRGEEGAHVRVNGVLLGAEPTPLLHGDKVEIAGLELHYADDAKAGATQHLRASDMAALAPPTRPGSSRPTTAFGGRLVSLVDGKEYVVADSGLVFGREAACDVVVPQTEVSRRHASIEPGSDGYHLTDTSANGVFVNGVRVVGSHRLSRADVIRIGTEEYRFYANVPSAKSSVIAPIAAVPAAALVLDDQRPVLASLEGVNEGPAKGTVFELRTHLTHVGRGRHNDVSLQDESVSEIHAKLQRREDGWYVVDMDSTNGTYVGGNRVMGEKRLDGSPDVRFGGMKFRFRVSSSGVASDSDTKGTRAIARATLGPASTPKTPFPPVPTLSPSPASTPTAARGGLPSWLWVAGALVAAGAAFFVLKGRA